MKKLLLLALFLLPNVGHAAFPTNSILFVAASSQVASIAYASQTGLELSGTDFTIEFWYKPTAFGAVNQTFFSRGYESGESGVRAVWNNGSGLNLSMANAGSYYNLNGWGESLSTGTWYHIAFVFDYASNTAELFINGTSQGTKTVSGASVGSINDPAHVGATIGAAWFADGNIGLERIWKVKRTQAQIDANKCTILGSTTNLSAEWTFDNTYNDNSGNSNTLTGSGSPTFPSDVTSSCATPAAAPYSILGLVRSFWIL